MAIEQVGQDVGIERFTKNIQMVEQRDDGVLLVRSAHELRPYPARLHDYLMHWADSAGDRVFLGERDVTGEWATISYAETARRARTIARGLLWHGLGPDRPLLILSGNSIAHQLLALGASIAGVPYTPLSVPYSTASEDLSKLKYVLALLDPGMVFAEDPDAFSRALQLPEMRGRTIVVGAGSGGTWLTVEQLLASGSAPTSTASAEVGPDTVLKVLFTSGSTGMPKGVITTHRMTCSNIQMHFQNWPILCREPSMMLDWLPWNHVFGGSHDVGMTLGSGGTLYIDDGRPVPQLHDRTVRNLRDIPPTIYWNVPKGFEMLIGALDAEPELAKHFFSKLKVMFYAGATLPEHLWRGIERLAAEHAPHPVSMMTGWGLTETGPSITMLNRHGAKPGSIGTVLPGQVLKLVPNGGKLEARVRGPNVTPGYWKAGDITASAFDDEGYFLTSDALAFVEGVDVQLGFMFDGRIAEDFKLTSGTWVDSRAVKERAMARLQNLAADVVITSPDRDDLGLLIFPPAKRPADYQAQVENALARVNDGVSGGSKVFRRAMIMTRAASLDAGEMTDKGSVNSNLIRKNRAAAITRLYAIPASDTIVVISE